MGLFKGLKPKVTPTYIPDYQGRWHQRVCGYGLTILGGGWGLELGIRWQRRSQHCIHQGSGPGSRRSCDFSDFHFLLYTIGSHSEWEEIVQHYYGIMGQRSGQRFGSWKGNSRLEFSSKAVSRKERGGEYKFLVSGGGVRLPALLPHSPTNS